MTKTASNVQKTVRLAVIAMMFANHVSAAEVIDAQQPHPLLKPLQDDTIREAVLSHIDGRWERPAAVSIGNLPLGSQTYIPMESWENTKFRVKVIDTHSVSEHPATVPSVSLEDAARHYVVALKAHENVIGRGAISQALGPDHAGALASLTVGADLLERAGRTSVENTAHYFNRIFDAAKSKNGHTNGSVVQGTNGATNGHAVLNRGIAAQFKTLNEWEASPRKTAIVIHSLSHPYDTGVSAAEYYDGRNLGALQMAADPNVRVIFVTARPLDPAVVRHALRGRPDIDEIISRIEFIALNDGSHGSLAHKLVVKPEHQGQKERIRQLIASNGGPAALFAYMVGPDEQQIADELGIPNAVYGPHRSLAYWITKSGNREIFKNLGLRIPDGEEKIFNLPRLINAINKLVGRNHGLTQVVAKLNLGTSGVGNAYVDISGWRSLSPKGKLHQVEAQLRKFRIGREDPKDFIQLMESQGAVVEAFVDFSRATFPSVQAEVRLDGSVHILATHEQVLEGGNSYVGASLLADSRYRKKIEDITRKVSKELAKKHMVLPWFCVDFAAVPLDAAGTEFDIYTMEANLRLTATYNYYSTVKGLTNAYYDEETGLLRRLDNQAEVRYRGIDHDARLKLIGLSDVEFLKFFERPENSDVLFDGTKGVVFHLLPAVKFTGNVGYTIIGCSDVEIAKIQARVSQHLSQLEVEHQASLQSVRLFRPNGLLPAGSGHREGQNILQ